MSNQLSAHHPKHSHTLSIQWKWSSHPAETAIALTVIYDLDLYSASTSVERIKNVHGHVKQAVKLSVPASRKLLLDLTWSPIARAVRQSSTTKWTPVTQDGGKKQQQALRQTLSLKVQKKSMQRMARWKKKKGCNPPL